MSRVPSVEELADNPSLFIELCERYGFKPKDLGITFNYMYRLGRGERRPSKNLTLKLIQLIKQKLGINDQKRVEVVWWGRDLVAGGGFEPPTSGL